ncbi:MAG: histidinol-phosphatase [Bacteroidales bacterium]|nr:histidinol-phosphatase [Bacteroidales bacterium]MCF6342210.1 histidinol-phosphatase [Bacteroidales bacterium]
MLKFNLHQHSLFSDGKAEPEAFASKAVQLGLTTIGFSEHSPLPFDNSFSLKEERVNDYIETIDALKEEYKGRLFIYRALEMDFIPDMSTDFSYWKNRCQTDYLIGSVHLVKPEGHDELWFTDGPDFRIYDEGIQKYFDGDIKKAVKTFYHQTNQMIETQDFDIVGHVDKIKMHNRGRFFSEDEKWYQNLIDETLELIKQKGLIVEVNTRGLYKKRSDSLFPDGNALQKVKQLNIPVLISSDAHQPDEMNQLFTYTQQRLLDFGFRELMFFENGKWLVQELKTDL